jgi:hypothetical protein
VIPQIPDGRGTRRTRRLAAMRDGGGLLSGPAVSAGRMRGRMAIGVLAVPAGAWAIGVPWAYSLLIAGLGAGAVAVLALPSLAAEPDWPVLPPPHLDGRRRDVMSLSWLLTSRRGGVDPAAVRRLREIARRRLGIRGIDLDSPDPAQRRRAAAALGEAAYRILADGAGRQTTHSELNMCVVALESLSGAESQGSEGR